MATSFSNTDTGDAPADPYKEANADRDVALKQKVDDLKDFMNACKFGMMTTRHSVSGRLVSRCMALAATETAGIDLIFLTNTESNKTDEITSDPQVNISFINLKGEWASISGVSTILTDRSLIKKHYNPELKAWLGDLGDGVHNGEEDDPRIGVIRVKMTTATYSLVAKGLVGRVAEIAKGMASGKPAAVNKLREITEEEVKAWRSSASFVE